MHGHITLLIGGPCAEKSEALLARAAERVRAGREGSFLFVVPSPQRAEDIREHLLAETKHGMFSPFVGTINGLIQTLYRHIGGREAPISDAVKAVLVQEIVARNADAVPHFSRPPREEPFPGLVTKLVDFISGLKRNLIPPEEFRAKVRSWRPRPPMRDELALIYDEYQRVLQEYGLVDGEGLFWLLRDELRKEEARKNLRQFDLLLVDGIHDLTRAEEDVLIALTDAVEETVIALDFSGRRDERTEAARELFESFSRRPSVNLVEFVPECQPLPMKTHIHSQLFARPSALERAVPAEGRIEVQACIDPQDEVRTIAERIKSLAREYGDAFDIRTVCVAFPEVRDYASLVCELFPRCGIPFELSAGMPLAQAPVTASIMHLLATVCDDYQRRDVIECLLSPYLSFIPEERETDASSPTVDGNEADVISREAGVIGTKEQWRSALSRHKDWVQDEIMRYSTGRFDPERGEEPDVRIARLKSRAAHVEALRAQIESFFELVAPLEDELSPHEFRECLRTILERLRVQEQIAKGYSLGLGAEDVRRDARAFRQTLKCLDGVVFSAGFSTRKCFHLSQYVDMLTSALSQTRYRPWALSAGVRVTRAQDARGLDADYLFLGGLVEGQFPRIRTQDIFLSDSFRSELGIKVVPTVESEDRLVFYQCLSRARQRVTLSYPMSVGGDERLRSPFVEEVLRIFEIEVRPPSCLAQPGTEAEFQTVMGRQLTRATNDHAPTVAVFRAWEADQTETARNVLRNLHIRKARSEPPYRSKYQGLLDSEFALARLRRHWPVKRAFSITQLEAYGKCPFSFFVSRVLGIEPLEDPSEDLTPLERGDILHRIFRRYYTERRDTDSADKNDLEALREHIKRIAEEEIGQWRQLGLFWEAEFETIVGNPSENRPGLLDLFVEAEFEAAQAGSARPKFFEVAFGKTRRSDYTDPNLSLPEVTIRAGDKAFVKLAGKIDRIDLTDDNEFVVVDYKTGSGVPRRGELRAGVSLQLPVYIFAVEQGKNWKPLGGRYYQVHSLDKVKADSVLLRNAYRHLTATKGGVNEEDYEEILEIARQSIFSYARAIRAGRFPPMSHRLHPWCQKGCQFSDICRVDHARMTDEVVKPLLEEP